MTDEAGTNKTITKNGITVWRNACGEFHREDGPAIETADGSKYWYRNGKRHREDGPAVEESDGIREWYCDDQLHREDGPAVEIAGGKSEDGWWFLHGRPWPEGPQIATEREKERQQQKELEKAIDVCRNGLSYDLPVGKQFQIKPKKPSL